MDGKVGSIALANATDGIRKGDSWAFVLVGEDDRVRVTQSNGSLNPLIKAHVRHVLYRYLPECWCDEHDAARLFRKMIDDAISDWVNEVQADRAASMALAFAFRDNGEEDAGA